MTLVQVIPQGTSMAEDAMQGKSLKTTPSQKSFRKKLESNDEVWRLRCYDLLSDQRFDAGIGFVILINSITIGMESSFEINGWDTTAFKVLEHLFLLIYALELGLRFLALGFSCLHSGWVGMGVLTAWIIEPIVDAVGSDNDLGDFVAPLMVLKVLRLFRLARAVRLLVQFKILWMLVRGLLGAAGTIFYTFLLIFLMLYITACLAAELISKPWALSGDPWQRQFAAEWWPDIPTSMMTLFQFVTLDSVGAIYFPMIKSDPKLMFLFMPFILIVSIALMNLVTAVIVEGAIEQGRQDRELQNIYKKAQIKALMPMLVTMFQDLDTDGDGALTLEELSGSNDDLKEELKKYINAESLVELFEMIDDDGSGVVSIEELQSCNGTN